MIDPISAALDLINHLQGLVIAVGVTVTAVTGFLGMLRSMQNGRKIDAHAAVSTQNQELAKANRAALAVVAVALNGRMEQMLQLAEARGETIERARADAAVEDIAADPWEQRARDWRDTACDTAHVLGNARTAINALLAQMNQPARAWPSLDMPAVEEVGAYRAGRASAQVKRGDP